MMKFIMTLLHSLPPAAGRLQNLQFCQAGLGCDNPNKCRMKDEQKIIFVRQGVTCSYKAQSLRIDF